MTVIGNALSGNMNICILSSTILTGHSRVHLQILALNTENINLKNKNTSLVLRFNGHRTPWTLTVIEISTGHSEWIQILRNWTMEIIPLGTENSVTTDQI